MSVQIVAPVITRPLLVALGSLIAGSGAWALWRGWTSRRWPAVAGEVVAVGVKWTGATTRGAHPTVRYRYAVGATPLEGTRLSFGAQVGRATEQRARAAAGSLAPGGPVAVHYNPRRPADAVLRPGASPVDAALAVLGLLLVASGVWG